MKQYLRAIAQTDIARPNDAISLAGGWCWFTHVEVMERNCVPKVVHVNALSPQELAPMVAARADIVGLDMRRPKIMGILNVTPDSFSDGGVHNDLAAASRHAVEMAAAGADIIDVGGESTRPGAAIVAQSVERDRTAPVIAAVADVSSVPMSIDTRKSGVAAAALNAGAKLINDVSGFTYDPELAPLASAQDVAVCVMHAQGDPVTMQENPQYDDVLLDVYDFLETQITALTAAGVSAKKIVIDPGIGFGKTQAHNLALLARLSLFHTLGCPVLLGASRKKFIGTIGEAPLAGDRVAGSVAVALEGWAQGAQIVRVHDVVETKQAMRLWQAVTIGEADVA